MSMECSVAPPGPVIRALCVASRRPVVLKSPGFADTRCAYRQACSRSCHAVAHQFREGLRAGLSPSRHERKACECYCHDAVESCRALHAPRLAPRAGAVRGRCGRGSRVWGKGQAPIGRGRNRTVLVRGGVPGTPGTLRRSGGSGGSGVHDSSQRRSHSIELIVPLCPNQAAMSSPLCEIRVNSRVIFVNICKFHAL